MNRKVIKVVSILLMVLMVVTMLSTSVLATSNYDDINQFNNQSKDTETAGVFQGFIATVINLVQVVGIAVAIIMLIVMAIKYITAAPSEKAEFKKSAVAYIVGAIVLFAATGILQLVKNFASTNINNNVSGAASSYVVMMDDETYFG